MQENKKNKGINGLDVMAQIAAHKTTRIATEKKQLHERVNSKVVVKYMCKYIYICMYHKGVKLAVKIPMCNTRAYTFLGINLR